MKRTGLLLCLCFVLLLPACVPVPAPTPQPSAPTGTAVPLPTTEPTAVEPPPQPTAVEPTATVEPTAVPEPTTVPPAGDLFSGLGIRLYFTGDIAGGATFQTVPASPLDEPFWSYPESREVALVNYTLPATFHAPRIAVYPVEAYRQMNPSAGEQIDRLQQLLAERSADPSDQLPTLPFFNAARVFSAQIQYLDFVSGSGIRYLTMYSQYFAPINNHELFYAFQGLTADGQYFVAAVLPVSAPFLPADATPGSPVPPGGIPYPDFNAAGFEAAYPGYIEGVRLQLQGLPGDQYTPGLPALDAMLASLEITP